MDKIFAGIMRSDYNDKIKKNILDRVTRSGKDPQSVSVVIGIFRICLNLMTEGCDESEQQIGVTVFQSWARYNRSTLESFFTKELLLELLSSQHKYTGGAVLFIHEALNALQNSPKSTFLLQLIEVKSISFIRDHPQVKALKCFCDLLMQYRECIPKGEFTSTFCISIIHSMSAVSPGELSPAIFFKDVHAISSLLGHILQNTDSDTILLCLQTIFRIISSNEDNFEPSICLGSLVQHVPVDMMNGVIKKVVADVSITDANMAAALSRMIDWLKWLTARKVDEWIVAFLKGLSVVHKYSILIEVTLGKVDQVFSLLQYPIRGSAMNVMSHMLMSCQHSPEAFHKIAHQIPAMVHLLQRENSPSSFSCLDQLSVLCHTLMYQHPGFPDVYEPLLESLKGFHKPSIEEMRRKLSETKWNIHKTDVSISSKFAPKSETGKTGLVNLGNTCYMNSVLQALFMCDSFRRDILTFPPDPQCSLVIKLQHVFAFLTQSQRAAYAPNSFLKASRPPWFSPGHQQDCSEFLRYLIDQLHEQELMALRRKRAGRTTPENMEASSGSQPTSPVNTYKTRLRSAQTTKQISQAAGEVIIENDDDVDPTLIGQTFGGKMITTYKCLNCGQESSRTEAFTDIPLAFPNGSKVSSDLVGGRPTSEESQNKMDTADSTNEDTNKIIGLEDLVDFYLQPEKLDGDNKYHCDNCRGLQNGERILKIVQSPSYLNLTLLRFSYDIKTQSRSKLLTEVSYPKTLLLPTYSKLDGHETASDGASQNEVYSLASVIVHSGTSSECGHYYCYARHSLAVQQDLSMNCSTTDIDYLQDKWYLFNDSRVTYSSYCSFSNVTKRFARDTAYVLVYKKISAQDLACGVDLDESIRPAVVDPPLRKDLWDIVAKDNAQYFQEQEREARAMAARKTTTKPGNFYHWGDSDDNGGPPGSCGPGSGGGLGDMDTSGARFVF